MNIPIFRAKKIDSDEYVAGSYIKHTNPKQLIDENEPTFIHKIIESWNLINEEIDLTTLSIHFPDMTDSQGNKIFASLSEDGKGGDKMKCDEYYGIAKYLDSEFVVEYENVLDNINNQNFEVIGIQD